MKTKNLNGTEYIVYEAGMILNDATKSYYFNKDLRYKGEVQCMHFYAEKDVFIDADQYVYGKIYVGGDMYITGFQGIEKSITVRGSFNYVGGHQVLRGKIINAR